MTEKLLASSISTNRCEISRTILVANITSTQFNNVEALKRYFGSQKRSGGGSVETVLLLERGKAFVTFQDHKGLSYTISKLLNSNTIKLPVFPIMIMNCLHAHACINWIASGLVCNLITILTKLLLCIVQ